MKKSVYRYLFKKYGDLPLFWFGIATEIVRSISLRVVAVLIVALLASNIASENFRNSEKDVLLFAFVYAAGSIVGIVGELLSIRTTDDRYQKLLADYYVKLTGKDLAFYRDSQTGILTGMFRQHLDGTIALIRLIRGDVVKTGISLIFPVLVLFAVSLRLGIIATGLVIVESSYVLWSSHMINKYRKLAQEAYRKLNGEVNDVITNIVAYKSSGFEKEEQRKIVQLAGYEARAFWLRHKATVLLDLPNVLMTGIAIGSSFITIINTFGNLESVGLIFLVFVYLLQIMRAVTDLPDLVLRHDEHVSRVYPTLEYIGSVYETVLDPVHPKSLLITNGAIKFKDVLFIHKNKGKRMDGNKVFDGLNLEIKGGERVGIVGLSGAGKSTLAGLLMRFDDVDRGSITIDGIDLREVCQADLRRQIAYVPQEPLLFHSSIKKNITYFNQDATESDIERAAKAAHAHQFITNLKGGYETTVGERGIQLSGGQKQRIVVARAILKNAPILIFDEATSALDSESEKIMQDSLSEIIGRRTVLVIAHRLSTVARLDRIIVLQDGSNSGTGVS